MDTDFNIRKLRADLDGLSVALAAHYPDNATKGDLNKVLEIAGRLATIVDSLSDALARSLPP
jgi:hypothetical protein